MLNRSGKKLSRINLSQSVKLPFSTAKLTRIVAHILDSLPIKKASVTVMIVGERRMQSLHKKYKGKDCSTDVLAFEHELPQGIILDEPYHFLGDVVVCADEARKRASEFNHDFKQELVLYMIHGILHLIGYRDGQPQELKKMERKQEQILAAIEKNRLL